MIRALLHQWGDRFHRWLDLNVVADDPNPLPSQLDLVGGTYSIVHDALVKGTTFAGVRSLTDQQTTRAAHIITNALDRTLLAALRADMQDDPDLAAVYAARFGVGEVGHVSELRRGVTGRHVEVMRGDGGRAR